MYSEKMEKIEDIINDIRIKDTLYIKKLKSQVMITLNFRTEPFTSKPKQHSHKHKGSV